MEKPHRDVVDPPRQGVPGTLGCIKASEEAFAGWLAFPFMKQWIFYGSLETYITA